MSSGSNRLVRFRAGTSPTDSHAPPIGSPPSMSSSVPSSGSSGSLQPPELRSSGVGPANRSFMRKSGDLDGFDAETPLPSFAGGSSSNPPLVSSTSSSGMAASAPAAVSTPWHHAKKGSNASPLNVKELMSKRRSGEPFGLANSSGNRKTNENKSSHTHPGPAAARERAKELDSEQASSAPASLTQSDERRLSDTPPAPQGSLTELEAGMAATALTDSSKMLVNSYSDPTPSQAGSKGLLPSGSSKKQDNFEAFKNFISDKSESNMMLPSVVRSKPSGHSRSTSDVTPSSAPAAASGAPRSAESPEMPRVQAASVLDDNGEVKWQNMGYELLFVHRSGETVVLSDATWHAVLKRGATALEARMKIAHKQPIAADPDPPLVLSALIGKFLATLSESKSLMIPWIARQLPSPEKTYLYYLFDNNSFQLKLVPPASYRPRAGPVGVVANPLEVLLKALIGQERFAEAVECKRELDVETQIKKLAQQYDAAKREMNLVTAGELRKKLEQLRALVRPEADRAAWSGPAPPGHMTLENMRDGLINKFGAERSRAELVASTKFPSLEVVGSSDPAKAHQIQLAAREFLSDLMSAPSPPIDQKLPLFANYIQSEIDEYVPKKPDVPDLSSSSGLKPAAVAPPKAESAPKLSIIARIKARSNASGTPRPPKRAFAAPPPLPEEPKPPQTPRIEVVVPLISKEALGSELVPSSSVDSVASLSSVSSVSSADAVTSVRELESQDSTASFKEAEQIGGDGGSISDASSFLGSPDMSPAERERHIRDEEERWRREAQDRKSKQREKKSQLLSVFKGSDKRKSS
eukprot:TRINITY_DN1086_c0_g1_i2.p1 TRINITY_DN1086_c0_g1~~TRINITY_DN1086_c0_g1_i2.p1  ORF type:complete len:810 (-),score=339.40 TRINITY_DN1086_c0_g1_i2:2058-4487(-)